MTAVGTMHLVFAAFKGAMSPMVHALVNENKLEKYNLTFSSSFLPKKYC